MQYLSRDTKVWAIPKRIFKGNTQKGWDFLLTQPGTWDNLEKRVKMLYTLAEASVEPWNNFIPTASLYFFYRFPEPLDDYVGFLGRMHDIKQKV